MPLQIDLSTLSKYRTIPEIQSCLDKSDLAGTRETVDRQKVDMFRGQLLRTLDKLSQTPSHNLMGIGSVIQSFSYFFKAYNLPKSFEDLWANQYHEIQSNLIELLYQLSISYPININDPIYFEPLPSDRNNRFITLTGIHYPLKTMVKCIRHTGYYVYPHSNYPMYDFDRNALIEQCRQQGISLAPYPKSDQFYQVLSQSGLSLDHLDSLNVEAFHTNHITALNWLMEQQAYSFVQAIDEIQALNSEQVSAVLELFHLGLRGEHLRNLRIDPSDFTPHHSVVLASLVEEHGYSIEEAVNYISDKTMDEVQAVYAWKPLPI